jgi:hypothetical protein
MTLWVIELLLAVFASVLTAGAQANCDRPVLIHQGRDAATIQKLESAWERAYLTGDTEFEVCLLAPDFAEIMADGRVNHLSDELALVEKNIGKPLTAPHVSSITVRRHGNVAV